MREPKLPRPPDAEHLSARPMRTRSTAADLRAARRMSQNATASRQLEGWLAAVVHLHEAGLPAAVPELAAAWCRRRGVRPDWETAA